MTVVQAKPARELIDREEIRQYISEVVMKDPVRDVDATWQFGVSLALGKHRAQFLYWLFTEVLTLPGDVAEFGVFHGQTSRELVRYLEARGIAKTVHLFDTFTGLPDLTDGDYEGRTYPGSYRPHLYLGIEEDVRELLQPYSQFAIHRGLFSDTGPDFHTPLCFAHIDADLYAGTRDAIQICERVMIPGGVIVIDDYGTEWLGVTRAVKEHLCPFKWDIHYAPTSQCIAIRQ